VAHVRDLAGCTTRTNPANVASSDGLQMRQANLAELGLYEMTEPPLP
jgi:hypothetical protein